MAFHTILKFQQLPHHRQHLPGHGRLGDVLGRETILRSDTRRQSRRKLPIPVALGRDDLLFLMCKLREMAGTICLGRITFLPVQHPCDRTTHQVLDQGFGPRFADWVGCEHCNHVSLSYFDDGQQECRPFHRVAENIGSQRDRQKRGCADFCQRGWPAAAELEDSVSAHEMQTPSSAGMTRPGAHAM